MSECYSCGVIGIEHPHCDDCMKKAQARIDDLETALIEYINADEVAVGHGYGCYAWRERQTIAERFGLQERIGHTK